MQVVGFFVSIPAPPTINNAFVNIEGKGRRKSDSYRKWVNLAIQLIHVQVKAMHRVAGEVYISIELPSSIRGDIDNRVKGILDALVGSQRIDDDRNVWGLRVQRSRDHHDALVAVMPRASAPDSGIMAMSVLDPRRVP